jgi:hypothetical protein
VQRTHGQVVDTNFKFIGLITVLSVTFTGFLLSVAKIQVKYGGNTVQWFVFLLHKEKHFRFCG